MKVLLTGGTGRIGSAVAEALIEWGAGVSILCRSPSATVRAEAMNAEPVAGDIRDPRAWLGLAARFDAVVHAAATFDADMGAVDAGVVSGLLERLGEERRRRIFLYTGGVWVYGNTRGPGDETTAFDPPREWRWMAEHAARVTAGRAVHGLVIHPAIVVADDTGVPRILTQEACRTGEPRFPGHGSATWPLVNRADLAALYALVLDGSARGESYTGASIAAAPVRRLAVIAGRRLGLTGEPVGTPVAEWMERYGDWASGYALSQNFPSGKARQGLGWEPRFTLPE